LRDLAGLIVIDFIDMDEPRNNAAVERRLKEALKNERARIQVGKMSGFGLMEMSRQRLRSSVLESSYHVCPHCGGKGLVRSTESAAMHALHILDEAASKNQDSTLIMTLPPDITNYILNMKRNTLQELENRFKVNIQIMPDDNLLKASDYRIERLRADGVRTAVRLDPTVSRKVDKNSERMKSIDEIVKAAVAESENEKEKNHHGRRRRHDWKRKQKQLAENQAQVNEERESEKAPETSEVNFTIVEQTSLSETETLTTEAPTTEKQGSKKGRYRDRHNRRGKKGNQKKETENTLPAVHEDHVPAKREEQPLPAVVEATEKPKRGGWWNRLVG
jgi:ribonuclease E